MIELPIKIEVTIPGLLEALREIIEKLGTPKPSFQLEFETLMPTYKATHPDFTFRIKIRAVDAEGHSIADAPIPQGSTLVVTSDAPSVFSVVQDTVDPKLVSAHVEGPLPGTESSTANVTAQLFDAQSNLVATGVAQVVVTVGDPTAITEIVLDLPASDV